MSLNAAFVWDFDWVLHSIDISKGGSHAEMYLNRLPSPQVLTHFDGTVFKTYLKRAQHICRRTEICQLCLDYPSMAYISQLRPKKLIKTCPSRDCVDPIHLGGGLWHRNQAVRRFLFDRLQCCVPCLGLRPRCMPPGIEGEINSIWGRVWSESCYMWNFCIQIRMIAFRQA